MLANYYLQYDKEAMSNTPMWRSIPPYKNMHVTLSFK